MIKASTLDIAKHKDPIFIVCTQTKYSQNLISEKHIYWFRENYPNFGYRKRSQSSNYENEIKKLTTMIEKEHDQASALFSKKNMIKLESEKN